MWHVVDTQPQSFQCLQHCEWRTMVAVCMSAWHLSILGPPDCQRPHLSTSWWHMAPFTMDQLSHAPTSILSAFSCQMPNHITKQRHYCSHCRVVTAVRPRLQLERRRAPAHPLPC